MIIKLKNSSIGRSLIAAVLCYSINALADTAIFTLQDQTGLSPTHKIWVAGFSAATGDYLYNDGTWKHLPLPTRSADGKASTGKGQIPCYQLGHDANQINHVVIDSTQNTLSARIYFFVDDTSRYPGCNNGTANGSGIFGTTNLSWTSSAPAGEEPTPKNTTYGVVGLSEAAIDEPGRGVPVYNFGEIGSGPQSGTIDTSQVDLYSFPVTIQASVLPDNPAIIGNTMGVSFEDNAVYKDYIQHLVSQGRCEDHPNDVACAYLDLMMPYKGYQLLLNPGAFLASNTEKAQDSKLHGVFDNLITSLWGAPQSEPIVILDNGGIMGHAPQETFEGTPVTMTYPCSKTLEKCPTVQAIRFVGQTSHYVAYLYSPIGYDKGCAAGAISNCPAVHSSGYQVFAGAGVFASTANDEYTNLTANKLLPEETTKHGRDSYNAEVARLGLIMTQAMNHGAFSSCQKPYHWTCLNLETNWYPTQAPGITQNLFAQFMHIATNANHAPLFTQPPNAAMSSSGVAMGMAYGFSNDENPTPVVPNANSPQVPSKMDQTVLYNGPGPYTITLGPWSSANKPLPR